MFQPDPSNFLLSFVLLFTKLLMIKENLDMYLCYLQNTYLRITDRGTLSKTGYVCFENGNCGRQVLRTGWNLFEPTFGDTVHLPGKERIQLFFLKIEQTAGKINMSLGIFHVGRVKCKNQSDLTVIPGVTNNPISSNPRQN